MSTWDVVSTILLIALALSLTCVFVDMIIRESKRQKNKDDD